MCVHFDKTMKRNDFSVASSGAHFKVGFTADLSAFQNYQNFLSVQRNLNTLVFTLRYFGI